MWGVRSVVPLASSVSGRFDGSVGGSGDVVSRGHFVDVLVGEVAVPVADHDERVRLHLRSGHRRAFDMVCLSTCFSTFLCTEVCEKCENILF